MCSFITHTIFYFLIWLVFFNIYTQMFLPSQQVASKFPLRFFMLSYYFQDENIYCHYFNSARDLSCQIGELSFVLKDDKGVFLYHGIRGEYENGSLRRLTENVQKEQLSGEVDNMVRFLNGFLEPSDIVRYAEVVPVFSAAGKDFAKFETDAMQMFWWGRPQPRPASAAENATESNGIQSSSFFTSGQLEGIGDLLANSTTGEAWSFSFKNIPFRETSMHVMENDALAPPSTIIVHDPSTLGSELQFEIVHFEDAMKWLPLPGYYANATLRQLAPEEDAGTLLSWDGYNLRPLTAPGKSPQMDETAQAKWQNTEKALQKALVSYRRWSLFWKDFLFDSFRMMLKIMKLGPQIERIKYTEGHFVLGDGALRASAEASE